MELHLWIYVKNNSIYNKQNSKFQSINQLLLHLLQILYYKLFNNLHHSLVLSQKQRYMQELFSGTK